MDGDCVLRISSSRSPGLHLSYENFDACPGLFIEMTCGWESGHPIKLKASYIDYSAETEMGIGDDLHDSLAKVLTTTETAKFLEEKRKIDSVWEMWMEVYEEQFMEHGWRNYKYGINLNSDEKVAYFTCTVLGRVHKVFFRDLGRNFYEVEPFVGYTHSLCYVKVGEDVDIMEILHETETVNVFPQSYLRFLATQERWIRRLWWDFTESSYDGDSPPSNLQ